MILGTGLRPFESGGVHEVSLAHTSRELLPFLTVPVPVLEEGISTQTSMSS